MNMSLCSTSSPFQCWEGAQFLVFSWNLIVVFGRNKTDLAMRCLYMLPEDPASIHIHLRKVMKHSSSNGCLSLSLTITFPVLKWWPKLVILFDIGEYFPAEMTLCWPQGGLDMLWNTLPIILIHIQKDMKYSSSNGYCSLCHISTWPVLIWYPKVYILLQIWEYFPAELTQW